MTTTTNDRIHDDATTHWGSVHSPVAAVPIQNIRPGQLPMTTYIRPERTGSRTDDRQTMTFMLDESAPAEPAYAGFDPNQWHRRIGDDLPTFSVRKDSITSRKMPPPAPLVLGPPSTKNPIIVKAAMPSPPEPPEQAIEFIKSQLKKFEQPDSAKRGSPGQRLTMLNNLEAEMDMQQGHWREMQHDMSRDSLSTLRTSPGMESRRESLMSIADNNPSRQASVKSNLAADRRAIKRSKMRSGGTFKSSEDTMSSRMSVESTAAGMWQARLADAQNQFVEKGGRLTAGRNMNIVPISQLGSPTPPDSDDSDAEVDSRPSLKVDTLAAQSHKSQARKSLWTPATGVQTPDTALLWTAGAKTPHEPTEQELPGLAVRPVSRVEATPLEIKSDQLWRPVRPRRPDDPAGLWGAGPMPTAPAPAPPQEPQEQDMFAEELQQPEQRQSQLFSQGQPQKAPRANPPRPPRRSKRVTLLPDILESPEPLPDKRGTLGIFQFPWGERSDTATVQPRGTMFMAMPGTMTSGGQSVSAALAARAKQVEESEYSSSFFDDYDEEDDSDANDSDGSEGDDGFDETTLWEIASLLKTELVPSKNSLLPPPRPVAEQSGSYMDMPSDSEEEDEGDNATAREEIVVGIAAAEEETAAPAATAAAPAKPAFASLWDAKKKSDTEAKGEHGVGLPPPDARTWELYDEAQETARAKPRQSQPAIIESNSLWGAAQKEQSAKWAKKTEKSKGVELRLGPDPEPTTVTIVAMEPPRAAPVQLRRSNSKEKAKKAKTTVLWVPPTTPVNPEDKSHGLFQVAPKPTDTRTTTEQPAAVDMVRVARTPEHKELEKLTSADLWSAGAAAKAALAQPNWMEMLAPTAPSKPKQVAVDPFEALKASKAGQTMPEREPFQYPDLLATLEADEAAEAAPKEEASSEVKQGGWWGKMMSSIGIADAAPVKPKPVPARLQHRPNIAVHGGWNTELREAILLSYPSMPRPIATPEMWAAALAQAVARSKPYDPTKTHPVFHAPSLVTASEHFHPAATGYTYDVARVHPVFFGSATLTCDPEQAHPAFTAPDEGRRPRRQRSQRNLDRAMSRERSLSRAARQREPMVPLQQPDDEQALLAKRNLILAQIEALEREKHFVERSVRGSTASISSTGTGGYAASQEGRKELWSKPADIQTGLPPPVPSADMWTPGPKTPKSGRPVILAKVTDSETEALRSKSRKERGSKAAERQGAGGEEIEAGMWTRFEGHQRKKSTSAPRGQGKDWLDETTAKRKSSKGGVVLRY
jgi:hypothetical protein